MPDDTKRVNLISLRSGVRNLDLARYQNQTVAIRLYGLILVPGHEAGNSYWKNLKLQ